MRVRLEFDAALVAEELRCCLFAVPVALKTVADLVRIASAWSRKHVAAGPNATRYCLS